MNDTHNLHYVLVKFVMVVIIFPEMRSLNFECYIMHNDEVLLKGLERFCLILFFYVKYFCICLALRLNQLY